MTDPQPATPPPGDTQPRLPPVTGVGVGGNVGGDVAGRDVVKTTTAGRDVVGGDVVTTTHVGFSPNAVLRLVIAVGALVFVTAFCFFSSGLLLGGGAALVALNRSVASSTAAAQRFADGLAALRGLQPGQTAAFTFTEEEISSYFRFVLGPSLGGLNVQEGRVRLLDDGELVVGGTAQSLGGLEFAATFVLTQEIGRPLNLTGAAVRLLPTGTRFGWVLVPTSFLGGVEQSLNALFGGVQVLEGTASDDGTAWTVTVMGH